MSIILITGANRGLGLGLVKKFLEHPQPPKILIATSRNPTSAGSSELNTLATKYPALRVVQLDVNNPSSFPSFAQTISDIVGDNGLNVLINNAGIASYQNSLADITEDNYSSIYKTNVIGPVFLTKALHPLIRKASLANVDKPAGINRAAVINISSLLGSITLNEYANFYAYRESKAALNMFTKSLSCEFTKNQDGILAVTLHPGWVKTDLGGAEADLEVDVSVSGMCKVIHELNESAHGQFIQWDGKKLPW